MSESAPDPSPDLGDAVERALREAPIVDLSQIGIGSNVVFQALLDLPPHGLLAIYKPARGERPLWDFPDGTLYRREVATAVVDRALGWKFTPATVVRRDAPLGVGSMQAWVSEPPAGLALDTARLEHRLRGLAALDVVINNADRKRAHLLVDAAGELKGIDHGVTFNPEFKLRTVLADLGGNPVPQEWLDGLRSLIADQHRLVRLRRQLRPLLTREETAAFEERAHRLVESGVFPRLHPWHGRPFEW